MSLLYLLPTDDLAASLGGTDNASFQFADSSSPVLSRRAALTAGTAYAVAYIVFDTTAGVGSVKRETITAGANVLQLSGAPGPAYVGQAYSFTPTTQYANGAVTYSSSGTLPSGLSFSTSTGAITGTPTATATFSGSITGTDAGGNTSTLAVSFSVTNAIFAGPNVNWVAEGDSITAGSYGPSYVLTAMMRSRARFYIPNGWTTIPQSGDTAANMAGSTETSAVDALAPKVASLLAGTNDINAGTSAATVYGYLKTWWKGRIDAGAVRVIAMCVLPRVIGQQGWTSAYESVRQSLNTMIRNYASDADLANYASKIVLVDVEGTFNASTMTEDGLHPNWAGAFILGNAVGDALNALHDAGTVTDLYNDPSNLFGANAQFTGTGGGLDAGGTGTVPNGMYVNIQGGMTVAVSPATLNGGPALRLQISGTNSTEYSPVRLYIQTQSFSINAGQTTDTAMDFSVASGHSNIRTLGLYDQFGVSPSNGTSEHKSLDGDGYTSAFGGTLRTVPTSTQGSSGTLQFYAYFDLYFLAGSVSADLTIGRPYCRTVP